MFVWLGAIALSTVQLSFTAQPVPETLRADDASSTEVVQRVEELRSLLIKNPDSKSLTIELAQQLARSSKTVPEAIDHFESLARSLELADHQRAIVLYELAYCHEQLGQEGPAEKRLIELSELSLAQPLLSDETSRTANGTNVVDFSHSLKIKAILRLASLNCDKRQDQVAADWLSRIKRSDIPSHDYPNYALLFARNAIDCSQANKADEVLQTLECYQLTDEQRTSLEFLSIQAAMELRDYERAESSLSALADLAQSEVIQPEWAVTVALRRIELALTKKQHSLAAELATEALQSFPLFEKNYEFLYLLSRAEIAAAQFTEAREHLQAVVDSPLAAGTETAAKAQWMIGETFFLQQSFDQAIQAYQRVLNDHHHPLWKSTAALQLAKCYEQLGRIAEATKMYEMTTAQFSGSQAAEQAALRLSELSGLELKGNRR